MNSEVSSRARPSMNVVDEQDGKHEEAEGEAEPQDDEEGERAYGSCSPCAAADSGLVPGDVSAVMAVISRPPGSG